MWCRSGRADWKPVLVAIVVMALIATAFRQSIVNVYSLENIPASFLESGLPRDGLICTLVVDM